MLLYYYIIKYYIIQHYIIKHSHNLVNIRNVVLYAFQHIYNDH